MPFSLLPAVIADSLPDITPKFLHRRGVRLLMLDFDNTIVPYTNDVPTSRMYEWLNAMKESDIQLCIVSNSKNDRVKAFCTAYGLDCITHARKPMPEGIIRCLKKYGIPASQSALVGDQIYTDTLGANVAGVTSILIKAIDNHNFWLKARHVMELPFIAMANKRRIENEKS